MAAKRALVWFGLTLVFLHVVLVLVAWADVRATEAEFGYIPANTIYNRFADRLNYFPVLKQLHAGDKWDFAFSWINRLSARQRARRDTERGVVILFCGNGRTFLWGINSCEITALRSEREPDVPPQFRTTRYLPNDPGVLDEIVCDTTAGTEVTIRADLLFGGCSYDVYVRTFIETYNEEVLARALSRITTP